MSSAAELGTKELARAQLTLSLALQVNKLKHWEKVDLGTFVDPLKLSWEIHKFINPEITCSIAGDLPPNLAVYSYGSTIEMSHADEFNGSWVPRTSQ